ncbi:flagellar biosynthesis protein FlhF [Vallitaleaceae bacterium 9-2]
MNIHKYKGQTEKEAMTAIKAELGPEALIVSVKHVRPKGIFKLFRKSFVEVTAAIDDRKISEENVEKSLPKIRLSASTIEKNNQTFNGHVDNDSDAQLDEFKRFIEKFSQKQEQQVEQEPTIQENKVQEKEEPISSPISKPLDTVKLEAIQVDTQEDTCDTTDIPMLQVIYEQLIDNEIDEKFANELMMGLVEYVQKNETNIDDIVSIIYKRIVKNMSDYDTIDINKMNKNIFFIGPTGVGKTTTIAKIASLFSLNHGKDVALITSDTYRIAAVEQLRTYANILGIPIKVVYSKEEMMEAIEYFSDKELVLIDTAGRSYKNQEHQFELKELLDAVVDKEVFLTLSVATKYRDMLKMVKIYKAMTDFRVIFTKLDETISYGNIFNIRKATGIQLSYITFGQNVPDDISEINPHDIAKSLLGGEAIGSGN